MHTDESPGARPGAPPAVLGPGAIALTLEVNGEARTSTWSRG